MSGLNIRPDGGLDFLSLGAIVCRLDPGAIPFRKAQSCALHVSGGEYNVAAGLADCFGLRAAVATAMVDYPLGELVADRVRSMGVLPFYKRFAHDGVRGPNIQLAKTILYNLNPADNALFATMIGNFQDGSRPGKMQWGAAWWFLDQLDGMEAQLRELGTMGLLARFVGMVTDSRSFLSYSRHDYFRRLLCQLLGEDVRRGRLPDDRDALGRLVANVSFHNAKNYFGF